VLYDICRFGRVWCVGLFVILVSFCDVVIGNVVIFCVIVTCNIVRVRVIWAVPTLSTSGVPYNPSYFSISNRCRDLRIVSSFYL